MSTSVIKGKNVDMGVIVKTAVIALVPLVKIPFSQMETTKGLIQYKDAILPVSEIPLWGQDELMTILSLQWDFL